MQLKENIKVQALFERFVHACTQNIHVSFRFSLFPRKNVRYFSSESEEENIAATKFETAKFHSCGLAQSASQRLSLPD